MDSKSKDELRKQAIEACKLAATEFACLLAGYPHYRGTAVEEAYHKCNDVRIQAEREESLELK